jgi:hypothetical protein
MLSPLAEKEGNRVRGGGIWDIYIYIYRKYPNDLRKKYIEYFFVNAKAFFLYSIFLASAKSNFGAIFWLFYGIFRIFWKNSGFSYTNQLWKIRFLLHEMGPCLFAFVKHLDIYGT